MNAADYRSFAVTWEERATIRTRPRRQVEDDQRLIYPLSRQPLVLSETFQRECPECRDFVLVQSLYKFINDVVIFETEIVDRTARRIAKDRFAVRFPFACRYDAMTVVVDEDYHALVALNFQDQTRTLTGIEPLDLPSEIELSRAIPAALACVPAALQDAMELICVGIAESTLTDDVAAFSRDESVKPSVRGLMADHLQDEGRHSSFWARLARIYWHSATEQDRRTLAQGLPVLLEHYLTNVLQQDFDRRLIEALPVSQVVQTALRAEVDALSYPIHRQHPLLANILRFLRSSTLLESAAVREALRDYLPQGEQP